MATPNCVKKMNALIQLRDAYSALDRHVERREAAEIALKQLRAKLEQSKALKAMLSGLNKALTTSQQENASQRIEDALQKSMRFSVQYVLTRNMIA